MSLEDLTISLVGDSTALYDAAALAAGNTVQIKIHNQGSEDLSDLGIYVVPSTFSGSIDYPADYPPDTDYQDLLTWGEAVIQGQEVSGGLVLTIPVNGGGTSTERIGRTNGSSYSTKIPIQDLDAGDFITIDIALELPTGVISRRSFINFVIE